jgi:competence protein ComEA
MARNEERVRVRQRLGALGSGPRAGQVVLGGRWDLDEIESEEPDAPDADQETEPDPDEWGEVVEGPRVPHWLSEPVGSVSVWHERLVPERFRGTRLDPGRRGVIVLAAVGLAAVVVAAATAQREKPVAQPVPPLPAVRSSTVAPTTGAPVRDASEAATPAPAPAATSAGERPAELVVSVVGLVEHAGLLHLPAGSRVADAVSIAVARDGADLASLNLAQRLTDGDQIVVGVTGPNTGPPQLGSMMVPGSQRPAGHARTSGPAVSAAPAARVSLNAATEDELDALPGVGPTTAHAIIAWRTEHGRFTSIDQLAEVTGIGPARLTRLRNLVTL